MNRESRWAPAGGPAGSQGRRVLGPWRGRSRCSSANVSAHGAGRRLGPPLPCPGLPIARLRAGDADPRPTRVTRAHASAGARRSTEGRGIPPSRTAPSSTFTERPRRAVAGLQARFILLLNAAPLESGETGGGSVGAALVPTAPIQLGAHAPPPSTVGGRRVSACVCFIARCVRFFFPPRVPRC